LGEKVAEAVVGVGGLEAARIGDFDQLALPVVGIFGDAAERVGGLRDAVQGVVLVLGLADPLRNSITPW
jgi:hypothetical protein